MNPIELQYLRDINRQLSGGIKQAVGDGMVSRQLYCMQQLVVSLIAERSGDQDMQRKATQLCAEQLPRLREIFADDPEGEELVRQLSVHHDERASTEILTSVARIAGKLGSRNDPASCMMLATLVELDAARWVDVDNGVAKLTASAGAAADREVDPFNAEERSRLAALLRQQCERVARWQ